ncbi:MAG TPA: ricin-type beta-trefoil lectin domain protein [Bryobacteraceae bacterium]
MRVVDFIPFLCMLAVPSFAQSNPGLQALAARPPMGWNDWAHYQCGYTAETIVSNARALVNTGLAARGYKTVTIDDCWMQKDRDAAGNLVADPQRFPQGIAPVARAVHGLDLNFGIYEDAGYETCGRFAGSGEPSGGGKDHFVQDAKLFASWGVDYLKLDGCNVYVPSNESKLDAYRRAYAAESAALKSVGRPIIFSESAPAYFQGTPDWYDVLNWVRDYGQLWREGTDIANFHAKNPDRPRFTSVLWNYSYNLPLGRFQGPGKWNDADFIIGGDKGMTLAETRSQMALWSMMSAPLVLSSDVGALSSDAIAILGNKAVIAVDQDPLGQMATLIRRGPATDVLFKRLASGNYALAVLNRGDTPARIELRPADVGIQANAVCRMDVRDLWTGAEQHGASSLAVEIAPHDTAIWSVRSERACGTASRTGTITIITPGRHRQAIENYTHCLAGSQVKACTEDPAEAWTVTSAGSLKSSQGCLGVADGKPLTQPCSRNKAQRWRYTLQGELVNGNNQCLTSSDPSAAVQTLSVQPCGHNQPDQIWSLPN